MFRPAALFIGLRYTRAKRRNHFISFISLMSMFGIALGVLVLITVLSVMNGFDREITKRVFSMVPAITVNGTAGFLQHWQEMMLDLKKFPAVTAVAPYVGGQGLLSSSGAVQPIMLMGIIPEQEKKMSELSQKMIQGKLSDLSSHPFGIVLGEDLANRLGTVVGERLTVTTPQFSLTPVGVIPRFKQFTVVGIFHVGSGWGFDTGLAFVNLKDAQKLFQLGAAVSGLHVNISNVYAAPQVAEQLASLLGPSTYVNNWTQQFGAFFHAVRLEKTMMFCILMLIVAVAVFNLVCTLVMVVNDKEADIAILRTFGATPSMIMAIFIVQGAIVGVIGTLLGVLGGIALAVNVTSLVSWIEKVFQVQFISSNVYFVDYLPSQLQFTDVWQISLSALVLSLLATLYPAWRASRTEPVEALRYE